MPNPDSNVVPAKAATSALTRVDVGWIVNEWKTNAFSFAVLEILR
jgi:hypothetical protein